MAYYKFTDQIYRNREIELFNDEKWYDMTYIDDVIDGITLIQFAYQIKIKDMNCLILEIICQ